MLERILDPQRPVPWQWHDVIRQTIMIVLVHPNHHGICLIMPQKDLSHTTIILPQGGIELNETLGAAARRELREEIPSLRRPSRSAPFRVAWSSEKYLGSARNQRPRSGIPKQMHAVALQALSPNLQIDGRELWNGFWMFGVEAAAAMLEVTRLANPVKYDIICEAIRLTCEVGMLY